MGPKPEDNYIDDFITGDIVPLKMDRGACVFEVECERGEKGAFTHSGVGVGVWPESMLREAPLLPKGPRLKMRAANGIVIDPFGTKVIRFTPTPSGFTGWALSVARKKAAVNVVRLQRETERGRQAGTGRDCRRRQQRRRQTSGAWRPMFVRSLREPTQEEREEHALSHLLFRSWCRHCGRGRGREWPHAQVAEEPGLPEMHEDLCFLGGESEPGQTLPVLVMRERSSKMMLAATLLAKSSNSHIARRIFAFMKEVGVAQRDLAVRTGQEPAVVSIMDEVGRARIAAGWGKICHRAEPAWQQRDQRDRQCAIQSFEQQARV